VALSQVEATHVPNRGFHQKAVSGWRGETGCFEIGATLSVQMCHCFDEFRDTTF
jgi:hypothetical protein